MFLSALGGLSCAPKRRLACETAELPDLGDLVDKYFGRGRS